MSKIIHEWGQLYDMLKFCNPESSIYIVDDEGYYNIEVNFRPTFILIKKGEKVFKKRDFEG